MTGDPAAALHRKAAQLGGEPGRLAAPGAGDQLRDGKYAVTAVTVKMRLRDNRGCGFCSVGQAPAARQGSCRRAVRRAADCGRHGQGGRLSRSQFSAQFKRAFGESPHAYLLTRRLERAAALLRSTDWQVADICFRVGLGSVGSFTTSFRRAYGKTPARYRAAFPPAAAYALIPECVLRFYGRPQHRTFEEDAAGVA